MQNQNSKKTALVTGATGGIGSSVCKRLMGLGYTILAPIRNLEKAKKIYGSDPRIQFALVDIENDEPTRDYILGLQKQGISFELVILAAGDFKWDDKFPGDDKETQQKNAIQALTVINYDTTESVVLAVLDVCTNLSDMTLVLISSQAAGFTEDNPKRINEEGYVQSKMKVSALGRRLQEMGKLKEVIIEEPALVGTERAKEQFHEKSIGKNPDWEKEEQTPEQYTDSLIAKLRLS